MNKVKTSFLEDSRLSVFILIGITLVVYFKSFFYDFSPMDEDWLIIRDQAYLKDWNNSFTAFHDAIQGLYYRPVQIVSYIIDYHIGGANAWVYHITNVVLHTISVVMLYKLLPEFNIEKPKAFFLSALFAVHPVALHAVAWIPGRHDLLLCLFAISSFCHLVKYLKNRKITSAIFHFLFFMLALFTKENSVFLFPLFGFIFFIFPPLDKKKLVIFGIIWLVQLLIWHFMLTAVIKTTLTAGTDFFTTLKSFSYAMLMFIGKSFIPIHQSVSPISDTVSVVAGIIVILLIALVWFKYGVINKKIALLGLGIYFGLLIVAVWFGSTLPTGEHLEHRVYTSMIGVVFLLSQFKIDLSLKPIRMIFSLVILLFGLKTLMRLDTYKDGISYLEEAVSDCPKNYFYHARLGNFQYDKGRFNEALSSYNSAIALYDKKPQVFNDRANAYVSLNKKDEAIADYTKAYELGKNPQVLVFRCLAFKRFGDYENAYNDLILLQQCCASFIPKGLDIEIMTRVLTDRMDALTKMISAQPDNALLYVNRAKFFIDNRMGREALADLKKACELEPKNEIYKGYFNELNSSFPH
jgi:tetratricopeptide (TPR) repeat protein